jgi:hypothetical protein
VAARKKTKKAKDGFRLQGEAGGIGLSPLSLFQSSNTERTGGTITAEVGLSHSGVLLAAGTN